MHLTAIRKSIVCGIRKENSQDRIVKNTELLVCLLIFKKSQYRLNLNGVSIRQSWLHSDSNSAYIKDLCNWQRTEK